MKMMMMMIMMMMMMMMIIMMMMMVLDFIKVFDMVSDRKLMVAMEFYDVHG